MTTQKGPSTVKFCINSFMCDSRTPHRVLLGEQTLAHKYTRTPVEAYSPDEGDHLLHYVPAEGDDHKQFLYDKETHRERASQLLNHEVNAGVQSKAVCAS